MFGFQGVSDFVNNFEKIKLSVKIVIEVLIKGVTRKLVTLIY